MGFRFYGMKKILAAALPVMFLCGTAQAFMGMGGGKKEEKAPVAPVDPGRVWKDDEVVLKFKDETIAYGRLKRIWAYMTQQEDPEKFEELSYEDKVSTVSQVGVTHLFAKKARTLQLQNENTYRAKYYDYLTRYMPAFYAEKVIGKEVNPTDEELLKDAPPALPEVQVRVLVRRDKESADSYHARIVAGEDMAHLVKTGSQGLSFQRGGLSEWLNFNNPQQFPSAMVLKFLEESEGAVLEPFYLDIGFLVVRIENKRSIDEVRNLWLEQNRDQLVFNKRKEQFRVRQAELAESNTTIDFKKEVIEGLLAGKRFPKDQAVVKIRDMEFTFDILLNPLMKQGRHDKDNAANIVTKFVDRAYVTEEGLRLGLDKDAAFMDRVRTLSERTLAEQLKSKIAEEAANAAVTEDDIFKYYERNQPLFMEPEHVCLSLMELGSAKDAEDALSRISSGEAFSAVASAVSADESRAQGGAIGCYEEKEIPAPLLSPLKGLEPGQHTTSAVAVKIGKEQKPAWVLLRVDSVLKPAVAPFDRVKKPIVEERIRTERRAKALTGMAGELGKEFGYENCFQASAKGEGN